MILDRIINKKQIEFISITEGIGGRRLSPLEIATLSVHAESENTARRRVTQEARDIAIKNGIFAYGSVPFGYTKDLNGFLVPIKEEAVIVKKIFEKYLENKSTPKIASELIEEGHKKSDGEPLTANHIRKVLDNKTYTGIIYRKTRMEKPFSKVRIQIGNEPATEIQHQAIISEEVFELAQQIKEKRKKPKNKYRFHFLSKILYCPRCNSLMYGDYRRNRYECKQRRQGKYKCPFINKPEVDSAVMDFLKSLENSQETLEKQLKTESKKKENERLIYLKEQNQIKFATGKINFKLYSKTDNDISRKLQEVNLNFVSSKSRVTMIDNISEFIAKDNLEELHLWMLKKKWKLTYDSNSQIVKLN